MKKKKRLTQKRANNSLGVSEKTIDKWCDLADEIEIQTKNRGTYRIDMVTFIVESYIKKGKYHAPMRWWVKVNEKPIQRKN